METLRTIALTMLLGITMAFSCEEKTVTASNDCGCNGTIKSTIVDKQGVIEVLDIEGKKSFRISNKSENLFFTVCDTATVASFQRANKLGIKFSGNVKDICDKATVHLLPPIYLPIDLTKIESLN